MREKGEHTDAYVEVKLGCVGGGWKADSGWHMEKECLEECDVRRKVWWRKDC